MIDRLFFKWHAIFACERFISKVGLNSNWLSSALTMYLKFSVNPPFKGPVAWYNSQVLS